MAVAAWATDLTDIDLDPTGTGSYAALGGGASALAADTDFYVQGGATPSCLSKAAWTNAAKGMVNDTDGIPWSVPTDGVLLLWGIYTAQASLDTKANGGFRLIAGSGIGAYYSYYCGGKDTLIFESWVPYVVDPDTATVDGTVGSPTGTWNVFGMVAYLPSAAGPTKGNPIGIDALRYGRHTLKYTGGTGADPDSTFALAEVYANNLARRWGNLEYSKGAYYAQGFHSLGTVSTEAIFTDSNVIIFLRAAGANNGTNDAVTTGYTRFEIMHTSTVVTWDNIIIQALGIRARGVFVHTAGTWTVTNCQFIDVDTFSLLAGTVMTNCTFRGTNAITAPGSDLSGSKILVPTVAADASALVWNVATDPDGKLDDMQFSKGANAHHAIEFGTSVPATMTLRDIDFSGFNAADNQNDSTLYFADTSGTITLNLIGVTGNVSIKTAGVTVDKVINPVSLTVTCKDEDGAVIENARVRVSMANGTNWPYQASVTISRTGTTATVTHTSHGLATNDWVKIKGCVGNGGGAAYHLDGVRQITVTGANAYTYACEDSGQSGAITGTITATLVIINALTSALGIVTASRTYVTGDQAISGEAAKGTSAPYYKRTSIGGTIDKDSGLSIEVVMADDF